MDSGVIKFFRLFKNLRQEDLAQKVGVDQTSLSKFERGIPAISNVYLEKISEIFEINPLFWKKENESPFLEKLYRVVVKSRKQFIELLDFIAKYSNFVEGIALFHTDLNKFAGLVFKNEKAYFIVCFRPAINSSTYLTCLEQVAYIGIFLFKTTYSSELEDSYLNCFQNLTLSDVQRIIAYEPEVIEPDKKAKNLILFLKKSGIDPEKVLNFVEKNIHLFS